MSKAREYPALVLHDKYAPRKSQWWASNNLHNSCSILQLHRRRSVFSPAMALKAVHVTDVPCLDHASLPLCASASMTHGHRSSELKMPKFVVVGHRGNGMNVLQSSDPRMRSFKENSIISFNSAAAFPVNFIEFDVQVTKDDCPVIFHDNFILSEESGTVFEKRVTDLCLSEFLCYGLQRETGKVGKALLRKTKDGRIVNWNVDHDDSLCTLQEAFLKVEPTIGFNIEIKFDDYIVYEQDYLVHVLQAILKIVFKYANERPIIFSTFQPDAAQLVRKLQSTYPVFFLTDGGSQLHYDVRRNSLEEAIKLCLENGLQGIVSEVKAVFRNPGAVTKIRDSRLSLLTYGKLNNVPEAVYIQHLMGVDGVIVDLVQEITEAVLEMMNPSKVADDVGGLTEGSGKEQQLNSRPQFSQKELAFLLKLIPQLIQP